MIQATPTDPSSAQASLLSPARGQHLGDLRIRRERRTRRGVLHRLAARFRRALPR